jgi:hypothetical protein
MVRSLTFVLAMVGAAAVLTAQTPSQNQQYPSAPAQPAGQQPAGQTTSSTRNTADANVTWRGCLKPGTTAGTWILESAEMMPSAASSVSSTSSTSANSSTAGNAVGTSGASVSKRAFNLTPKAGDNLTPHTNHKIEVLGTVTPASSMPSGRAAADSSSTTAAPRQTLVVESFKMVSSTCP